MKRQMSLVATMAVLAAFAAEPKVGSTVALRGGYGPQQYQSNALFKHRPVAERMARDGIDLCLCNGWGRGDCGFIGKSDEQSRKKGAAEVAKAVASLKQFNCIWLITEHEDECPYNADLVGPALKAYVEAGGGLVVSYASGRYPEAPVDAYWTKVFKCLDVDILHEEVADLSTRYQNDSLHKQAFFFVGTFAKHPVTDGVRGLWLPIRGGYPSHCWNTPAAVYSKDWTPVATTTPAGKSYVKNRRTNFVEWKDSNAGSYRAGPVPVVAVRTLGKGRIVFSSIHKDLSGWMFGIDRWPNVTEAGEIDGKPSETLRLLENAFRWASEPSLADASFTKNYKPVEPDEPPHTVVDGGRQPGEKMVWKAVAPIAARTGVTGVAGLHTTYSDGESTVAEYAAEAKRLGLSFLVFNDDLAKLSEEKLMALRKDCAAASDESFYCCPGVEFADQTGLRWILNHDKVEYPKKDFLRDGRIYEVMKGGVVMQRNFYGHQNLYRGAILNTPRFAEAGIDSEQFADFNGVVPKAYDGDRLLWDNVTANKRIAANIHLCYPLSFTRIRRAADLARAKACSATHVASVAGMREVTGNKGAMGWMKAVEHRMYVSCGDVFIDGFALQRVPGTDVYRASVRARAPAGLREVLIDDEGGARVVARFDAGGRTDFARDFTFLMDRQMHLMLTVTDVKGHTAHYVAVRLSYPHSGLNRCSDNANFLACNPHFLFSNNWDDHMMPCWKFLCEPPRHWHFSEAFAWESLGRNKSRIPNSRITSEMSPIRLKGIDYPSEAKGLMPSSQLRIPLIAPQSVAVIDQTLGAKVMTPTRGPTRATYGYGPIQTKVGDGRYWIRRHRVYQFIDRADTWWRAVWQRVVDTYRGGYTVCEGEIEFTEDVTLAEPVTLCRIDTENAIGKIETYRTPGKLGPGGYYATVAEPKAWYAWFGLKGSDPLSVVEEKYSARIVSFLKVGAPRAYRKGERIRYRFACGAFNEPPREGQYLAWFAGMMDGSRFGHVVTRGKEIGASGLLDIAAEDRVAEVTLGPTWFIQDYPIRVSGLVDNGSAYAVRGNGELFRPLGFCRDGEAGMSPQRGCDIPAAPEGELAIVELPLEERTAWRLMNLFVADNPDLRFCYTPAMSGHEKASVQILNNTDRTITSRVRDLVSGETYEVTVPAGSFVVRSCSRP